MVCYSDGDRVRVKGKVKVGIRVRCGLLHEVATIGLLNLPGLFKPENPQPETFFS